MRRPRISFFLLSLLSLAALPLPAQALRVEFCVPACGESEPPAGSRQVFGPGVPITDPVTGITTTSIPAGTFTLQRDGRSFTVTATITSQQSGTLQKITFNPTTVTADLGSGCSAGDPCKVEVVATSDDCDFPTAKSIGGYPAGAFMVGSFVGPQGISPNGDTISSTGEASGTNLVARATEDCTQSFRAALVPVNVDVVNATPGTGPANTGTSLPSSCTGTTNCKFIASTFRKAFSTQITETVQQQCGTDATGLEIPSCLTRLSTKLNIDIKTAGNRVSLPYDWATANSHPRHPHVNPTEEIIANTVANLARFDVNSLAVGPQHFVMLANLSLDTPADMDPVEKEVYIEVGPYSTTILPGNFKRLQEGRVFTFNGKQENLQVNATFARDRRNTNLWEVIIAVYGLRIADSLPQAPLLTSVAVGIGGKIGEDRVAPRIFGNPPK